MAARDHDRPVKDAPGTTGRPSQHDNAPARGGSAAKTHGGLGTGAGPDKLTNPDDSAFFKARTGEARYPQITGRALDAIPDLLIAARIDRGMTQKDLAVYMGLKMQQIQAYEADRYQSASLSRIAWVAKALGLNFTLSGELAGNHFMSAIDTGEFEAFPMGEMYRRGWFGPEQRGVKELQRSSIRLIKAFFDLPFLADRRRYARTKDRPHEAALVAWETQLLRSVVGEAGLPKFARERIDPPWLRNLVRLSGKRYGLRQVRQHLAEAGLILRIEPALPGTSIDAAIIRTPKDAMIVALTLRKRREEEFWSALLHAIAHARLHVSLGEWDTVFHDNEAPAHEPWLADADVFAREALVPMSAWGTCLTRTKPTMGNIGADAKRLRVSPAVLVARLREEPWTAALPRITFPKRDVAKFLLD